MFDPIIHPQLPAPLSKYPAAIAFSERAAQIGSSYSALMLLNRSIVQLEPAVARQQSISDL